ncbi:hypothetical protein AaE_003578, partial [Aphanomyces astaci]
MGQSTIFSTIDLRHGFYQILMNIRDIEKTAVSTPSGILWEWLVMPQGLKNAPATFNRVVTEKLRPFREFAPSYFDDVYIHSRASSSQSDADIHRSHLRLVFETLRDTGLYANLSKCLFGVLKIPVLGDFVGINGCRADPAKVTVIKAWPSPSSVPELRSWMALATYLHKYSANFADLACPMTRLLGKDVPWVWSQECQVAFEAVKASLTMAPVLALPDFSRAFHFVVCDASIRAIGCCLMQRDDSGRDRPVSFQSRQLHKSEKNYPVHDLELLAMYYALKKFRIYLLGSEEFVVFTDHASLRTAVHSPHLSQRMQRWLSFFSEFNMKVEYKPGRDNVVADALSRLPSADNMELSSISTVHSDLLARIRAAYTADPALDPIIAHLRDGVAISSRIPQLDRYSVRDGLLL